MAGTAVRTLARERPAAHNARHTATTFLLVIGLSDHTAMDVMGSPKADMTKRYMHVPDEVRHQIARQIGGLLWTVETKDLLKIFFRHHPWLNRLEPLHLEFHLRRSVGHRQVPDHVDHAVAGFTYLHLIFTPGYLRQLHGQHSVIICCVYEEHGDIRWQRHQSTVRPAQLRRELRRQKGAYAGHPF